MYYPGPSKTRQAGAVREVEGTARSIGRPAQRVRFRAEAGHLVGVDVGPHKTMAIVTDLAGEVLAQVRQENGNARQSDELATDVLALTEATLASTWRSPCRNPPPTNHIGLLSPSRSGLSQGYPADGRTLPMYLTQALHRAVQQDRRRALTIFEDRVRSAAECMDRVGRLAAGLRSLGVGQGDRVALLGANSDRYHESLLAVPWADAIVVPINHRWTRAEVEFAVNDCAATVLIVDESLLSVVAHVREHSQLSDVVVLSDGDVPAGTVSFEQLIAAHSPMADTCRGAGELFGIFYTGGTTGQAKGVMLTHANMIASALGCLATGQFVTPGGRLLHAAPLFHLADLATWMATLIAGGTHVILPAFTPEAVLTAIERHRVSDVLLVPTMIQLLVDYPDAGRFAVASLQRLLYGGSPMPAALLARARKAFPQADFVQAYGMTELAPVATLLLPADHELPQLATSAGRAAPHSQVRIVDPAGGETPRGTVGEIVVRGDHVMRGYWQRPEETAAALRDGWMHTGDAGFMDEHGYVFVVDRIKDMIISGDENVYSAEVENVLALHPGVAACAVIGLPDAQWGERVHAVIVPARGAQPTVDDLRAFCRGHLAGYKIPRSVEFVPALPNSSAGKVLKRQLREERQTR